MGNGGTLRAVTTPAGWPTRELGCCRSRAGVNKYHNALADLLKVGDPILGLVVEVYSELLSALPHGGDGGDW